MIGEITDLVGTYTANLNKTMFPESKHGDHLFLPKSRKRISVFNYAKLFAALSIRYKSRSTTCLSQSLELHSCQKYEYPTDEKSASAEELQRDPPSTQDRSSYRTTNEIPQGHRHKHHAHPGAVRVGFGTQSYDNIRS